ncbi:MAG TPA: CPBP family intramembrane glutamic endopeptidase [Nocardioidaceae bacterium]|nr:CPBP family intramembrane glutamic endopeptidase [Nocardioidaceae bacterium]
MTSRPGSRRFVLLANATALAWAAGSLEAPAHRHPARRASPVDLRTAAEAVAAGTATFAVVYTAARVSRRIPILAAAATRAARHSVEGSGAVVATTIVNGVAEELYFRDALFRAVQDRHAVATTSASYVLVTAATGNLALTLASAAVGPVLGWQRRRADTVIAPVIAHLTWSALSLWLIPPLFADEPIVISDGVR